MPETFCKCRVHRTEEGNRAEVIRKGQKLAETSEQLSINLPFVESVEVFEHCDCSQEGVPLPRIDKIEMEVVNIFHVTPIHGKAPKHPRHLGDPLFGAQMEEGYGES